MSKNKIKLIAIRFLILLFSAELLFLVIGLFFNMDKESLQTAYNKPDEVSLLYVDESAIPLYIEDIVNDNNLIEDSKYGKKVYRFDQDEFEFNAEVEKSGKYMIAIDYYSENENITNTSISVYLNGVDKTLDQYMNIELPTMWTDSSNEYLTDIYNNEVVSMQVNAKVWRTTFLYDQLYYEKNPIGFQLNAGVNTIKFVKNEGSVLIGNIYLYEYKENLRSYESYLETIKNYSAASNSMFVIEAEQPLYKSSADISPASNNNAGVTPYSTSVNKLNVLSGDNFSKSGASVTYGFYIEKDGLYNISLKYFISQKNTNVYSKIYVDNEILFENLNRYGFINKQTGFKNETLNVKGDNIEFYLEEGFHTLTLQLDASLQAPIYNELNALIDEINDLYLEVIKLTNGNVDKNYVWGDLDDYLPNAKSQLLDFELRIKALLDEITEVTKGNKDEQNALYQQIKNAYGKIKDINKNPNKLPQKLNILSEGQSSCSKMLSSSIHTSTFSPITIDKIYIHAKDTNVPKISSNFFTGQIATFQRIFKSGVNVNDDKNTINIWVNRSTYYVSLMQQFADAYYYPQTKQKVRFSLLPDESKIIYANASNTQPDAAFGVTSAVPYDLGLRGALVNMKSLDGFNTLMQEFSPGAFMNKTVGNAVYGFPETQDFQVTFYRTDLVEDLGIQVPQTYDDLVEILPSLQRYGMNYYMPLAGGTGLKSIGTTAPFIYQYGGDIYSDDFMSAAIDSKEAIEAINMMVELFTIYSLPTTAQNFYQSFRDGNIPIGVSGFDMYLQVSQAAPEIQGKWDITLAPGVLQEDGTIDRSATGAGREIVMFNKSKKTEATWEFIKWWLSSDIQSRFASAIQQTYGPTFLWNTANIEAFKTLSLPQKHKEVILEQWEHLIQIPQIPATYIIERGISDVWNKAVFDQKPVRASISDMMIEMNNEIKRKMIEFGYLDKDGNKIPGVEYYVPSLEDIKSWTEEE